MYCLLPAESLKRIWLCGDNGVAVEGLSNTRAAAQRGIQADRIQRLAGNFMPTFWMDQHPGMQMRTEIDGCVQIGSSRLAHLISRRQSVRSVAKVWLLDD